MQGEIEHPAGLNFQGYLLVRTKDYINRWKTRYFSLIGNMLYRFPTSDSSTPSQVFKVLNSDLKFNEKKLEIRLKAHNHHHRKLELRARDLHDFNCWQLVLQRAAAFDAPSKIDPFENVYDFCASMDSLDLDFETEDEGEDLLETLAKDNYEDFARLRDRKREALFKKFIELKLLIKKDGEQTAASSASVVAEQPPRHGTEQDMQRVEKVAMETLMFSAYFIGVLEAERDLWKSKYDLKSIEKSNIEESIRILAQQHRSFQKQTSKSFRSGSKLVDLEDDGEEDESQEFYDAYDQEEEGERFVIPPQEEVVIPTSRKMSTVIGFNRRLALPADGPSKRPSVWSVLKNNVGKDFSKISIPITFNEPLSALQKWAEELEYAYLLDAAAQCPSSLERLAYVAAFHCSHYSDTMHRLYKPFNPVLGETYECSRDDIGEGFRYVAEQVSHHPPISACHTTGVAGWEYFTTLEVKNAFKGKDMEIYPQGYSHVRFANGEHVTYKRATTCVRNIIVGKMWVDNFGEVEIVNHQTGEACVLHFKPYSFFSGALAEVSGVVRDSKGHKKILLAGKWDEGMTMQPADKSTPPKLIWRRNPLPHHSSAQYEFTSFAMTLNEMEPGLERALPPTDSRLRSDLRLFEEGRVREAQEEKDRLEEKQRAARRLREASGQQYFPQYFQHELDTDLKQEVWKFNGQYWQKRKAGDWSTSPQLFGA